MNDRQTPRDAWPSPELDTLTLGMLPLNDAAPLVVARERGFFAEQGLDVTLSVESSWAGIRDAMQLALLDGAQMLPLMPLASTLGLDGRRTPMLSALTLSLGGNAITVSNALYDGMLAADPDAMAASPTSARALATVVRQRRERGAPALRFASVYPFPRIAIYCATGWRKAVSILIAISNCAWCRRLWWRSSSRPDGWTAIAWASPGIRSRHAANVGVC